MRSLCLVFTALLLLPGCASTTVDETASPTTTRQMSNTTSAPPTGFRLLTATDTLHFAKDHLDARPPTGQDERLSIPTIAQSADATGTTGGSPEWSLLVPDNRSLTKLNASLWVEVQGTVVSPSTGNCFWVLTFFFAQPDGNSNGGTACLTEPVGPVTPGLRQIQLESSFNAPALPNGTHLVLRLSVTGVAGSDGKVDLVMGSVVHDSQISVPGLQFPL